VTAAAVIPAPRAYINVVAVNKPVVGFENPACGSRGRVRSWGSGGRRAHAALASRVCVCLFVSRARSALSRPRSGRVRRHDAGSSTGPRLAHGVCPLISRPLSGLPPSAPSGAVSPISRTFGCARRLRARTGVRRGDSVLGDRELRGRQAARAGMIGQRSERLHSARCARSRHCE